MTLRGWFGWDDAIERDLKTRWDNGEFCSTIAKAFGCSRNAVIGKARRMKLPPRATGMTLERRQEQAPRKPRAPKQTQPLNPQAMAARAMPFKSIKDSSADQNIPHAQRKTLLQLENHHCRWPVGEPKEPGLFYCGAPEADVAGRIPYCRAHAKRAKGRAYTREEKEDAIAAQRAYRDANKRAMA